MMLLCQSSWSQTNKNISYALLNLDTQELIATNNENFVRPIASITKVMSALVVLNGNLDMDELLTVTGSERSNKIRRGMKITRQSLVELALVGSDNLAARTLAETYPGGYQAFIEKMNETALSLGMENTSFSDATGLLSTNTSNALDIAKMMSNLGPWGIFSEAANKINTVVTALTTQKKTQKPMQITVNNTNNFVGRLEIIAAKTGYTTRAGRCLTMAFNRNGNRYLLVVMGATNSSQRTRIVESLIQTIQ